MYYMGEVGPGGARPRDGPSKVGRPSRTSLGNCSWRCSNSYIPVVVCSGGRSHTDILVRSRHSNIHVHHISASLRTTARLSPLLCFSTTASCVALPPHIPVGRCTRGIRTSMYIKFKKPPSAFWCLGVFLYGLAVPPFLLQLVHVVAPARPSIPL